MDVQTQITRLEEALETNRKELLERLIAIEKISSEVRFAVTGGAGVPGIAEIVRNHEMELREARNRYAYQKGVIAVLALIAGALGSLVPKLMAAFPFSH